MTSTWAQKNKTDSQFSYVSFGEIPQYYTLVFQGNLCDQFFLDKRHKFAKILTFFVLKIRILLDAMCCKNFGRFYRRKFKKITKE